MKKLCFVNGSPRGNNSASKMFIDELGEIIKADNLEINNCILNNRTSYDDIASSDILVIVSPLYVDSLPSTVIEFLENFEGQAKNTQRETKVYAIVNCGFYEGIQNRHALKIIENFCKKVGYEWRFGVGIGAGGFMGTTKGSIPFNSEMKKETYDAFLEIKKDIVNDFKHNIENFYTSPNFPKQMYITRADANWIETAKSMSVSEEQLYARPFSDNL